MPVEISEVGPCKKKIKVTVERERVRQEIDKNYREICKTVALPGFRKGHVPRAVVEKRFGPGILADIQQSLIRSTLSEALDDNKLQILGEPKLEKHEFDKEKDPALQFEATVAVRPEFAIPALDGLKAEKAAVAVTDEEVNESLEHTRRARGEMIDRPEDEGFETEDAVIANVEFVAGGEVKRKEEGGHIWPKNNRIGPVKVDDLAAKFLGKTAGDTVEIEVPEFPKAVGIEGPGSLRVQIRTVRAIKTPALDEAFAKDAGFENLGEMREEVRSRMLRAKDESAEREVEEKVVEELMKRVGFELPEDIIDQELDELALRAQTRAKYLGKSEEEAAAEAGKVRGASRDEVVQRLKAVFLLDKIAREQKIFATEDEVAQAVLEMAARYGKTAEEMAGELEQSGAVNRIRHDLRMDKTRKFLRSKAEVIEK